MAHGEALGGHLEANEGILALSILLAQRERNKAIGIRNDAQFLRGLGQFIQSRAKRNTQKDIETNYLYVLLYEYQKLAKVVTDYIEENIEDQDTRNEGLRAMIAIESQVNFLGKQLEELWQI